MKRNFLCIIVPVYNVSKYLNKCIDSLLNQSNKNFFIALVDDGSTDDSGLICDNYAMEYPDIIKVYHKKNGGLSDARNYGIKNTDSDYIIFVDSDDYVGADFVNDFYQALIKYEADMVVTPLVKVFPDGKTILNSLDNDLVMEKYDALEVMSYEKKFGSYAVSKMIKRDIVEKYPFPVGKLFEDSYTTYKYIMECEKIVCLKESNYFYLQRYGSIQRSDFSLKHFDLIYATKEMLENYKKFNFPEKNINGAIYKLFKSCHITLLHSLNSKYYDEVFNLIKLNLKTYQKDISKLNITLKEKIIFKFLLKCKFLYKLMYKLKERN